MNRIPAIGVHGKDYTVEVSAGQLAIKSADETRPGGERTHFSLTLSREGMSQLAEDALAAVSGMARP